MADDFFIIVLKFLVVFALYQFLAVESPVNQGSETENV